MVNKDEVLQRAIEWKHSPTGRVITALKEIFSTAYPDGTNIELRFYEKMKGLPYGHPNKCIDKKTDCAELPRVGTYLFHGIDIGSYTDAQYKNGEFITKDFNEIGKAKPLDLAFYKTSALKKTGHVAIVFDDDRLIQSGAAVTKQKVGFTSRLWLPVGKTESCFMGVKRYLTEEQIASVTIGGNQSGGNPVLTRLLKKKSPMMRGEDVKTVQIALFNRGYTLVPDGVFGKETDSRVRKYQKDNGLKVDGIVGEQTAKSLGLGWQN